MKFIVDNRGDMSVGISGFQVEVEIKHLEGFEKDFVDEFVSETKSYLKDWFEMCTSCEVYTEEEYEAMCNFEEENLGAE